MPGVAKDDEKLNRSLCQPGSRVFYWERAHAWALGRVVSDDGKYFTVKGDGYSSTEVAALETEKVNDEKIWPANREDVLDEDVTDLLDLTILHDSTIQRCLYIRYMKDMVYTNIGAIVVALNPWNFKIPWYTDDNMHKYLAEGETVKNNVPHSWAQAHNTYNDMKRDGENQTILISGESGAGKTEAAKIVMKYLGAISCMRGEDSMKESAKKVAFNINQASPILEGFGNAKTVRNDNSSRFGKFMKVQFNEEGFLVGAYTIKYLLEKSRIVTANPNERVYHSFYLLLQGKDAGKYELGGPSGYHVNAGNCIDIPGVDDGEDYSIALSAMDHCGFSANDIEGVWSAVAGMLHILQVKFKEIDADSSELDPSTRNLVDTTAKFWQIDGATLAQELQTTTIQTRDGPVVKQLTTVKAADARDAVVKGTYDELFAWQVDKINGLTDSGTGSNWIGLLDIFGFEDFEYNSFEQLCINLANETLQNHYNAFIFTKDMDECRAEGVDVTEVKCPDSTPCLNMMTQRGGIFSQLDDECSLGASGTDEAFLAKVLDVHTSNPFFAIKKGSRNSFIVHHYAASVNYTVENWLEKNRDTLKPDMKLLMRASKHPLIASLIEEPDENVKKMTTGGFFKNQLTELMDVINSTNPHWIRCVKPHPAKKPLKVDGITCMQQLESSGVLGTVKIRKAGFPVRPTYAKFIARFKCIMGSAPAADADPSAVKEYCKKVIEHAGIEAMKAQCGKTKVFLKNEANQQLEAVREKALYIHVKRLVQASLSVVSQLAVRKQRWEASARLVQAEIREWLVRSQAVRAERERERAAVLEAMKAVLAPFNAELDAATEALRSEEQEEWDALARQSREGLGGMVAAFMSVVTNAEEERRFELELQEDEEWTQLAAQLNEARISAMFHEVEAEEARLRHALEEEWWLGGRRTAGWSGVGDDVTEEVMGAAPTLASIKGLSGALEEYFAKEVVILEEDLGEWSEPYNRNVVLKEEMRRRQLFTRQFVVAHTEARLGEEQLFEFIWREDIKDSEETEYQIIAQAFFEGTRRLIDEPGTLKGMSSEPSCRKLIEKERRDNVRGLHRQWRLLRLQAEEEATRFCAEGQQYFFDRETTSRHMLSIQEAEMRETVCQKIYIFYLYVPPPTHTHAHPPHPNSVTARWTPSSRTSRKPSRPARRVRSAAPARSAPSTPCGCRRPTAWRRRSSAPATRSTSARSSARSPNTRSVSSPPSTATVTRPPPSRGTRSPTCRRRLRRTTRSASRSRTSRSTLRASRRGRT